LSLVLRRRWPILALIMIFASGCATGIHGGQK
jgi:hypothetical protein